MMGHGALYQSTINNVRETACRAVNRQFQSHHTQTLEGHIGQTAVEICAFIAKGKVRANGNLQAI